MNNKCYKCKKEFNKGDEFIFLIAGPGKCCKSCYNLLASSKEYSPSFKELKEIYNGKNKL